MYQVGEFGLVVHNTTPDCLGWVLNSKNSGIDKIFQGYGREMFKVPGYADEVFWHAFKQKGDKLFDVIKPRGTDFSEWVAEVARSNGMSVDDVLNRIRDLPFDFPG